MAPAVIVSNVSDAHIGANLVNPSGVWRGHDHIRSDAMLTQRLDMLGQIKPSGLASFVGDVGHEDALGTGVKQSGPDSGDDRGGQDAGEQ